MEIIRLFRVFRRANMSSRAIIPYKPTFDAYTLIYISAVITLIWYFMLFLNVFKKFLAKTFHKLKIKKKLH